MAQILAANRAKKREEGLSGKKLTTLLGLIRSSFHDQRRNSPILVLLKAFDKSMTRHTVNWHFAQVIHADKKCLSQFLGHFCTFSGHAAAGAALPCQSPDFPRKEEARGKEKVVGSPFSSIVA